MIAADPQPDIGLASVILTSIARKNLLFFLIERNYEKPKADAFVQHDTSVDSKYAEEGSFGVLRLSAKEIVRGGILYLRPQRSAVSSLLELLVKKFRVA